MLAGLVSLALAVNGPVATGVALVDEPTPEPSLSEQVLQDAVTPPVEATDEATTEATEQAGDGPSDPASDPAGDAPTDVAPESATPSEDASVPSAQPGSVAVDEVDGATESPSATEGDEVPAPPSEESTDPEAGADEGDAPPEPPLEPTLRSAITPFAAGDATIRVRKAGDRLGNEANRAASGLAGAVFEAYADGSSQTQQYDPAKLEATCTTDANGICDLKVDSAKGPRYVVVEKSAPAGWRKLDKIALGRFDASGTPREYRWNVRVRAGETTVVPQTEITVNVDQASWSNRPSSTSDPSYQWADARDNVPLPPAKCGLNIALLFDQSGSIGTDLPKVKSAATKFIDDLTGTPTSIALFTFSTNSPQNNGGLGQTPPGSSSQNRPDLVSIADPAGASQVKGYINGLSDAAGGTNWDAGLRRVANASQQYDVLIVLTDGNPTAWEGEKSSTGDVNDYDVENAVHSANWVKSKGTRIVAVGFSGQAGGLNSLNLTTISGTDQNDDYYLTTFGDLDDVLAQIALNGCGGTISVQKKIAPTWNGINDVPLEPSWPFGADPSQDYVSPMSGTTGPRGEPLTFSVRFDQGELIRDVTIVEPPNHNSTVLVQDEGRNARCTVNGQPLPNDRLVNVANGFTVLGVTDKQIISCLVVDSDAQLQAVKYGDTNGNGTREAGEPGLPGWTVFLDDNGNSSLDTGERSVQTDAQGLALFDRLEAPKEYRVCEVLQDGWFNTDPGGGVVCKTQQVNLGDSPAGPVLFGNVQAGGFTITKEVLDTGNFVPDNLEFTINVACTPAQQLDTAYPQTFTLTDGQSVSVGPLINGTTCTVTEIGANGAVVDISQETVTIPDDDDVTVTVTNTYPVGLGEVVKVIDGPLAGELAPVGTKFKVEVTCTFPAGYPVEGEIPGYNPKTVVVESSGVAGQAGPAVGFGPLPVGSTCKAVETNDNGADPSGVTPDSITIAAGGPTLQTRFTATNTYNPAAVRIVKRIVPDGSVPADTEFTALVECWFPTNPTPGVGIPNRTETVPFTAAQPGVVSNLPLNAVTPTQCRVTETTTNGASATVAPAGLFPVNADPVTVTVTNTFQTGQLTVEKRVVDPSGLVANGTKFTINVACTFAGKPVSGYPQDVVLTYPTDLSKTLTGLPYGTECVLTEPDLNGAASVTFQPGGGTSATVTIGPDPNDDQTVTATNNYPVGTFPITKSVTGPGAGFVPAETKFEVTVTCTLPADFPGLVPAPYVLTITPDQTITVPPPPSSGLPVGTTCTVAETAQAGAGSWVAEPDSVTITAGSENVEVVVTNTYPAGSFTVAKLVDGPGQAFVPPFTDYEVEVTCTYPDGFPDTGVITGFPTTITITSGSKKGVPGLPATVGPLPVGSVCTLVETPNGTDDITYDPSDTVTVPDGTAAPVKVVITNTYPVGSGEIVKVATGSLAGQIAPEGTVFLVELRCVFPADFPGQAPGGQSPDPIPGYFPLELAIESGPPGQPGIPTPFGPLPVGSSCSIIETQANGADPIVISPPGTSPVGQVTIGAGVEPVEVTVTNTFNPAALIINKELTGPGAPLLPTSTVFTARVVCTFQGQTTFDADVDFSVDNPGEVTGQPVGASCTVTETQTNGAPVPPAQTVVLNPPPDPVLKEITFVNVIPAGQLTVQKVIGGDAAGVVPDGVEFKVGVNCSFQGTPLPPKEFTFVTPDQLSGNLTGLPVGAECFVNESDDGGATSVEFVPPAGPSDPAGQSGSVTITADAQNPVTVTVRNIFDPAVLRINKVVQPQGVLLPPDLRFIAQVDCTFQGESIYSGAVEFGPTEPGVVSGLIVGAECTVTEIESFGATFEPSSQTVQIVGTGDPVTVDVTITNTFTIGSLTVAKAVDDGGTGFVPVDTPYDIAVACTFDGAALPGYPTTVTVTPSGGAVGLPGSLPVGTVCDLSEPDLNGAASVSFDPRSPVTITEEVPDVAVIATNVYPVGMFDVSKVVDGPGGPFVPSGTQFPIEVSCEFPAGFPVSGPIKGFDPLAFTLTDGTSREVGPLPVGSTCTITETDAKGAGSTSVTPDTVTVATGEQAVEVVVTNTYPVGSLEIVKQIVGSGAATATGPFEFTVTCAFLGAPLDPQPAQVSISRPTLSATVTGLPAGATCTVAELPPYGGADGPPVITPSTVTIGEDTTVRVQATNRFTTPPTPPTPEAESCDTDDPTAQVLGSITIPPSEDFVYSIGGQVYQAGTFPFPQGTYTVVATRASATPVATAGTLRQSATADSYSWTIVVEDSDVCPALTKEADPPSGTTVFTGEVVTYTITVQNGGDKPVVGETLTDTLPEGVRLITSSITPSDGVYSAGAGTITWTFDLPAASGTSPSSATFNYRVEVTTDEGSLVNSVTWVERNLTGSTTHPVEPGITEGTTDKPPGEKPPTEGLTDTGAGDALSMAGAGLLAMLLGGLMVGFDRRRRREQ